MSEGGFNFITMSAALKETPEKVEYVVDGLLAVGAVSLMVAKPFVGKSTAGRNAAFRVSRGEPFLGRKTKKCDVAFVVSEGNRTPIVNSFRKMGAGDSDTSLYFHHGRIPLDDPIQKLGEFIVENKIGFCVVDPLVMMIMDELPEHPTYEAVYKALRPFIQIAQETSCHILLIHHAGKSEREGPDALGSTAYTAVPDTSLMLHKKEGIVTLETYQRAGVNLPPTVIELDLVTDTIEIGSPLKVQKAALTYARCLAFLRGRAPAAVSRDQIREGLKVSKTRILDLLQRGIDEKEILRSGSGKRGDLFKYQAAPEWEERELQRQVNNGGKKRRFRGEVR